MWSFRFVFEEHFIFFKVIPFSCTLFAPGDETQVDWSIRNQIGGQDHLDVAGIEGNNTVVLNDLELRKALAGISYVKCNLIFD